MQQGNSLHQILKKEITIFGHVAFQGCSTSAFDFSPTLLLDGRVLSSRMIRYLFDKTHHRFCSSSYFEVGYQVLLLLVIDLIIESTITK